jgi:hypothetical protein
MRLPFVRVSIALSAITLVTSAPLSAQMIESLETPLSCGFGNRVVRTGLGATVGAFLGFVAVKINQSDWSDASHTPSALRVRNQATVAGALVGAALANLNFTMGRCRAQDPSLAKSLRARPITQDEIERSGIHGSVYDLVFSLRRSWLYTRGIETMAEGPREVQNGAGQAVLIPGEEKLIIYLDNARLGTISQLRAVAVAGVTGVKYYDPSEATYRWGAGHTHGAIQILTVIEETP